MMTTGGLRKEALKPDPAKGIQKEQPQKAFDEFLNFISL